MRILFIRISKFLLFLSLGYIIIYPPLSFPDLRDQYESYIISLADSALKEIKKMPFPEDTLPDPRTYQRILSTLDISRNEKLEQKTDKIDVKVHLLLKFVSSRPDTLIRYLDTIDPDSTINRDRTTYYLSVAGIPDNLDTIKVYGITRSFEEITQAWDSGIVREVERDFFSANIYYPLRIKNKTRGILLIRSDPETPLNSPREMINRKWKDYLLDLLIFIPLLFVIYILVESVLIKNPDYQGVLNRSEDPASKPWYPSWMTIIVKTRYHVILPFLIILYGIFGALVYHGIYIFDLLMGIAVLTLLLPLLIRGVKDRKLFKSGVLQPAVYKETEEKTSVGGYWEPWTYYIHKFGYEHNGHFYEHKVQSKNLKNPRPTEKYHVLILPSRPKKSVLVEMYIKKGEK